MAHFNPEELLALAQQLLICGNEAANRSAASRAYYGAFLLARELARIDEEDPDGHALTQRALVRLGEIGLAHELRNLRQCRNKADYKIKRSFSRSEGEQAVLASRRVNSALKIVAGRARYLAGTASDSLRMAAIDPTEKAPSKSS